MVSRKTMSAQPTTRHTVNVDVVTDTTPPVEIVESRLTEADPLSVEDDQDNGGDPYNSTGQFFALAQKKQAGG